MARLIVDASVAVKWFVLEDQSDRALALLDTDIVLAAPGAILIEVASALSRRVREGGLDFDVARKAITTLPRYFAEFLPPDTLLQDALAISVALKHPFYDCLYLSAARSRQISVLTADRKFAAKIAGTSFAATVTLLSDWK